jgi:multimeric flavodoxin WrbA
MVKHGPKLLAICGSERAGGNTDRALEYVGKIVARRGVEFRSIHLRDQAIAPCGACGDCNFRAGPCVVEDDTAAIVAAMAEADAILYATPVHGFGMAHLMQIFIERAGVGYLRFDRPLANKVGGALVISRRYNDSQVHGQLLLNLLLNRMIVVGSGFPALLRGDVQEDVEGLEAVDRMVHRLLDMVFLLRERAEAGPEPVLPCDDANERQRRPVDVRT